MRDLLQSARYTFCGIGRLVGLRGISRVRNPSFPEQHGKVTVPFAVEAPVAEAGGFEALVVWSGLAA